MAVHIGYNIFKMDWLFNFNNYQIQVILQYYVIEKLLFIIFNYSLLFNHLFSLNLTVLTDYIILVTYLPINFDVFII